LAKAELEPKTELPTKVNGPGGIKW
jgi:hypothetical protein